LAVRLPASLAARLERLVASGRFPTKADAVRTAIEALLDAERRRDIGERIAEGYLQIPQTDDEVTAATEAAIRSINEEPW
jgi:Arc/MetJ-type ribon-helix-helix transcriptional regulator